MLYYFTGKMEFDLADQCLTWVQTTAQCDWWVLKTVIRMVGLTLQIFDGTFFLMLNEGQQNHIGSWCGLMLANVSYMIVEE